jgi:hypothetical protein
MKPVHDAIAKMKVRRRVTMDLRRAKRLVVIDGSEERDTFSVKVRQSGWRFDQPVKPSSATGARTAQSALRRNGKEK